MKKIVLLLISILALSSANAQEFKTLTYFVNDSLKLELDLFLPPVKGKEKRPLLVHVHGGGFAGGKSADGHHIAKYAASQGYVGVSINYTLYMKDKNFSCDGILPEKIKAIQIAANQLQQAVVYLLDNADTYNIDPAKVFLSGSSAGAETILHAVFWGPKMMELYPGRLPMGFRYAGIIAGSGAIMDLNLITKNNIVPIMCFHGSCDVTVPYGTASHHYCEPGCSGWLMLFGSYSIYNYAKTLTDNTHLVTYCGGGHEYSDEVFAKEPQRVIDFMNRVLNHRKDGEHVVIATGKDCERNDAYPFCD
jgi:poly(3-hydroxybutyrate) depolymerase